MSDYVLSAVLELRDNLTSKMRNATRGFQSATVSARSASASVDQAAASMTRAGTSAGRLQQTLSQLRGNYRPTVSLRDEATSRLGKLRQELSGIASKAYTATVNIRQNGALGRLRGNLSEMASGAMMGLPVQMAGAAGIGYGIYDTINTYKAFEQQMAAVRAIATSDMGADEADATMKELTAKAREMGAKTQFTAEQAGKAFEYMGMAGWRKEQMLAGITPILDLALASREDLGRVSDIVTDAMTALKIDTKGEMANANIQQFTDVLASAATHSNTNISQMGEAFKYSASIAGLFTDSYKNAADITNDVALALSLMADSGIKGSQAGTTFRSMLSRMTSDSIQAAQAMGMLGVDIMRVGENGEKELKPLRDIFGDIREKMKNGLDPETLVKYAEALSGMKTRNKDRLLEFTNALIAQGGKLNAKDQAKFAKMFEGEEGLSGWIALMTADEATYQQRIRDLDNSKGAAAKMSETVANTLEGDIKRIQSAWSDFQIEIMSGKGAEGLRGFLQAVTEDVNIFTSALKDGFDISDVGQVAINILKQLKDKFLEMNGIGSILAGGALAMGLYKIVSLSKKAISAVKSLTGGMAGGAGRPASIPTSAGPASSIGSMVVNASSVVVNGRNVAGGGANGASMGAPGTRGATNGTSMGAPGTQGTVLTRDGRHIGKARGQGRAIGNRSATGAMVTTAAMDLKTSAIGGVLAAGIGAMDVMATRAENKARSAEAAEGLVEANEHLKEAASALEEIKADDNASAEDIKAATQVYESALEEQKAQQDYVKRVEELNAKEMAESTGGAIGSTAGTVLGGIIGSLAGPVGTQVGMVIGGVVGEVIGTKMGELATEKPAELLKEIGPTVEDEFGNEVAVPGVDVSAAEGLRALREETVDTTQAIADEMQQEVDSVDAAIAMVAADMARNAQEAATASAETMQNDFISPVKEANAQAASSMREETVSAFDAIASAASGFAGWISSLFSMGGGAAEVAHNASGTSYFKGGWTEINEHGGELVNLPSGTQIFPHATTVSMLRDMFGTSAIGEENVSKAGISLSGFNPMESMENLFKGLFSANEQGGDSSSENSPMSAPSVTVTGNTFTVREDADINRIAYELLRLIQQQSGNYNYVGG